MLTRPYIDAFKLEIIPVVDDNDVIVPVVDDNVEIVPVVDDNVVIVPVVDDNVGRVALPELFIDQFKAELLVFICPKKEVLL